MNTQRGIPRISLAKLGYSNSSKVFTPRYLVMNHLKLLFSPTSVRDIHGRHGIQPQPLCSMSNAESQSCIVSDASSPLELSSVEGKFLSNILQSQPHLFQFVVSQQLDELASDRDEAKSLMNLGSGSAESFLRRRIAEMKDKERQIAVEDVMYMSIVHNFSEFEVTMISKLSKCSSSNTLEIWTSRCGEKYESVHSAEIQKMITWHLSTILGMRGASSSTTTKIGKFHLGRIYASSLMYGYFLRSACYVRSLDLGLSNMEEEVQKPLEIESYLSKLERLVKTGESTQEPAWHGNLMRYVGGFDMKSLQKCAKLKSKEAVHVIERHTWALFGADNFSDDDEIFVSFPSLERLVLEAVTFGSFLWDTERWVDSVYTLEKN